MLVECFGGRLVEVWGGLGNPLGEARGGLGNTWECFGGAWGGLGIGECFGDAWGVLGRLVLCIHAREAWEA